MEQLIKNIIQIRKEKRISQKEIAQEYGIQQTAMSRLERGERKIEADLIDYFCQKFKMTYEEIKTYHLDNFYTPKENISQIEVNESQVNYSIQSERMKHLERENELLSDMNKNLQFTINTMQATMERYKKEFERERELREELESKLVGVGLEFIKQPKP